MTQPQRKVAPEERELDRRRAVACLVAAGSTDDARERDRLRRRAAELILPLTFGV